MGVNDPIHHAAGRTQTGLGANAAGSKHQNPHAQNSSIFDRQNPILGVENRAAANTSPRSNHDAATRIGLEQYAVGNAGRRMHFYVAADHSRTIRRGHSGQQIHWLRRRKRTSRML
jgi:hypothetical protein